MQKCYFKQWCIILWPNIWLQLNRMMIVVEIYIPPTHVYFYRLIYVREWWNEISQIREWIMDTYISYTHWSEQTIKETKWCSAEKVIEPTPFDQAWLNIYIQTKNKLQTRNEWGKQLTQILSYNNRIDKQIINIVNMRLENNQ